MDDKKTLHESHFLNLYSIALSDTQVDTVELSKLYEFAEKRDFNKSAIDELLLKPDRVKFSIPEPLITKIQYLYEFALMIWADGKVDEFEKKALKKFCYKFGFEKENIESIANFLLEKAEEDTQFEEVKNTIIKLTDRDGD